MAISSINTGPEIDRSMTLVGAIRRRWKLFLMEFFGIYSIASIVIFCLPSLYESEMELLVNNERQDLVVTPEDDAHTILSNELSEIQVNSEIEVLRSNEILRDVVLKAHLQEHEPGTVQAAGEASPAAVDHARRRLEKALKISAVKKSNIIAVSYRAKNPELAHAVLKQLLDTYLTAHLKAHGTPGSYGFFQEEAASFFKQLQHAEDDLTIFRERYSALIMPEEKDILMQRAVDAQASLEETESQIAEYTQKVDEDNHAMRGLQSRVTTQIRTIPQQALVERLTEMLAEEQNRRTQLLAKFLLNDRMVLEVEKEVADTTVLLETVQKQSSIEQATDINAVRQEVEKDLHTARANLAGLQARRQAQSALVHVYQQRMFELAGASVRHDALVRHVKELEDNYQLYEKKREESRIAQSLDQQRITNVAVIEQPSIPVLPASPRIKLDLFLALILSAFASAAIVLMLEYFQPVAPPTAQPGGLLAAAMTTAR